MKDNKNKQFLSRLENDWHDHKNLENESFDRFKLKVFEELKEKRKKFCDKEKALDLKVLDNDEQELYLATFDKHLRVACEIEKKQDYTSNAMFVSKLTKHELLLLKHLLLNQLREIDMILCIKEKLEYRDCILAEQKNNKDIEVEITHEKLGWMNED